MITSSFIRTFLDRNGWKDSNVLYKLKRRGIREIPGGVIICNTSTQITTEGIKHYSDWENEEVLIVTETITQIEEIFYTGHELYHFLVHSKQIRGNNDEEAANLFGFMMLLCALYSTDERRKYMPGCPECNCEEVEVDYKLINEYVATLNLNTMVVLFAPKLVHQEVIKPIFMSVKCKNCKGEFEIDETMKNLIGPMLGLYQWGVYREETMQIDENTMDYTR